MNTRGHKNALITGGVRRIGRSIALGMAATGWNVVVHCRETNSETKAFVRELEQSGVRAVDVAADLAEEEQLGQLFEQASTSLGPLTALVNNASIFEEDAVETVSLESWNAHMGVNFRAPFVLSQKFAANLPEDEQGVIINIIDQRVWNPTPEFTSYTLSKMGLWGATQVLAKSLAPRIRVNAIGPGPTLQSIHQSEADFAAEVASVPLKRDVTPQDISRGVNFILQSPTMTGQMIALDSGQHLGSYPGAHVSP